MTRLLAAALSLLLALQAPVAAAERAPAPSLRPVSVETPLSTPFASATTPSAETGAAIAASADAPPALPPAAATQASLGPVAVAPAANEGPAAASPAAGAYGGAFWDGSAEKAAASPERGPWVYWRDSKLLTNYWFRHAVGAAAGGAVAYAAMPHVFEPLRAVSWEGLAAGALLWRGLGGAYIHELGHYAAARLSGAAHGVRWDLKVVPTVLFKGGGPRRRIAFIAGGPLANAAAGAATLGILWLSGPVAPGFSWSGVALATAFLNLAAAIGGLLPINLRSGGGLMLRLAVEARAPPAVPSPRRRVIVIGAGAAGLGVARQLRRRGLDVVVLEKGEAPGQSWRHMPGALRLISPWSQSRLADSPPDLAPGQDFAVANSYAAYLDAYARRHGLDVRTGREVVDLGREPDGRLTVTTAGGETLSADDVVNATGYFSAPFMPDAPGAEGSPIRRLHFADFKDAAQVARLLGGTGKRVLVVGRRISAGQAVSTLAEGGFHVALSARGPLAFMPPSPWFELASRAYPLAERLFLLLGIGAEPSDAPRMQAGATRRLLRSGAVPVFGDIARFDGPDVVFDDGRRERFDLVLYATGFRPAVAHLARSGAAPDGRPRLDGMRSAEVPGLYFLGLAGLRNFRSRFLRGIRDDAAALAEEIASRR